MFSYKEFEAIVWKYCSSQKNPEEKLFTRKNDLTRALLSLPSSQAVSSLLRSTSDAACNNYRARGVAGKVAGTFLRRQEDTIAQNYTYGIGVNLTKADESGIAEDLILLINESDNLSEDIKSRCLEIDYRKNFPLFFATALKQSIIADINAGEEQSIPGDSNKEKATTKLFCLPSPSPWFTGRELELQAIHAAFFAENREIVEVTAPGGFGKTQLAKAYAERYCDSFSAIYWVTASDIDGIAGQYASFLEIDGQKLMGSGETVICHQFFSSLESLSNWLIIFDDADFASGKYFSRFTEQYLPKHRSTGKVLITARSPRKMESAHAFTLSTMENEPEAAVRFLMERSGDYDKDAAAKLAKRVSYLPLAMQLAASFVSAAHGFTLAEYLQELDSDISVLNKVNEESDYEVSLWQILQTTLQKIKEGRNGDSSSELAEEFLLMCSFCAGTEVNPQAFCWFVLNEEAPIPEWATENDKTNYLSIAKRLEKLAAYCKKEINQQDLVSLLVRYGLLLKGETPLLEILPPIQEMIRNNAGSDGVKALLAVDFMTMQKAYRRVCENQVCINSVYTNMSFLCNLMVESTGDKVSELQKLDIDLLGATYRLRAGIERLLYIYDNYYYCDQGKELEMDMLKGVKTMTDFCLRRPMTTSKTYELQLLDHILSAIFNFIWVENLHRETLIIYALTEMAMEAAHRTIDFVGYEQYFHFFEEYGNGYNSEEQILLPERTFIRERSDPLQAIIIYFVSSLTEGRNLEKYNEAIKPTLDNVEKYINAAMENGYWTGIDPEDGKQIIRAYREQREDLLPESFQKSDLNSWQFK